MTLLAERPAHVPADRVVDFDLYHPPEVERDFHRAWKALQAPGIPDLVWTPRNGGHWLATRGPLISRLFEDHRHFSSRVIMVPKSEGENHNMIPTTIDPPQHRPFRALLNGNLSPKAVGGVSEQIRDIAVALIEQVRGDGGCDFIKAYAEVFPIRIFLSIFDLPFEDAPRLKALTDQVTRPDGSMSLAEIIEQFHDYLGAVVDARIGSDRSDMISRMINTPVDGRMMSRYEALQLTSQVLIAGLDTVVNFLGFAMLHLATHPHERDRLAADPGLIPAAVDELFRRFPIVTIGREVVGEVEIDGVTLHHGDMVMMPTALHGLDERENERPMEVDFDRASAQHSTFGNGHHRCPGAHLARTEVRVSIEEWLARIPDIHLAPGAEVTFSGGIVGTVDRLPLVWSVE